MMFDLKEKPEDPRYIKRLHCNETQSTTSVGKGFDSQPCHYLELQTWEWAGSQLPGGPWEGAGSELPGGPWEGAGSQLPGGPWEGAGSQLPGGPWEGAGSELPGGPWEGAKPYPGAPPTTRLFVVSSPVTLFYAGKANNLL